jgi:hypothetical protein
MTEADGKPGAKPTGQNDPLSATGIFLDAFHWQSDPSQGQAPESLAPPAAAKPATTEASPVAQGEFTQLFGTLNPAASPPQSQSAAPAPRTSAAPQETPKQTSGDVTRIFMQQAAPLTEPPVRAIPSPTPPAPANPPRMKGYSSPGASDSASAEGSFTQLFRTVTPSPAPLPRIQPLAAQASSPPPAVEKTEWPNTTAKSLGATDLFRALSGPEGSQADRNAPRPESFSNSMPGPPTPGSVTMWIQKLSENAERSSTEQAFEPPPPTATPAPGTLSGQGEFTRIISSVPAPPASAVPKVQAPAIEPPQVAAPKLAPPAFAAPAVPAPRTKLQEMLPILLVLNAFLLVVLILVVIFALMRK